MHVHQARIAEVVYLCHPQSGATVDYARGALVGVVAALESIDMTFEGAVDYLLRSWEPSYRTECWPQQWKIRPPVGAVS